MYIARQESCFQPSGKRVDDYTKRYQKASSVDVDPGESIYNSWTTKKKHSSNNNIGKEAKGKEDDMCRSPPTEKYRRPILICQ